MLAIYKDIPMNEIVENLLWQALKNWSKNDKDVKRILNSVVIENKNDCKKE